MKKVVSIPPLLAALSVASGCAPIEQIAGSPPDIENCRMESAIGSHIKDEYCDPNSVGTGNSPGRDANGIFGDILAEQMDMSTHNLPEPRCRPRR